MPPVQTIVGDSPAMREVAALLARFGQTDEPVLITGESGTGKELLARAIHDGSTRAHGPFVAVNCAAIPSGLVASELFGHEKGAFTGAAARNPGQIEIANGGTLFLDEIGDMPIGLQGHLLRFLQEGQIRRLGGRDTLTLNVRIVSATNVRLARAINEGRFREDLYYRLNVLTLPMPPLRDRKEDVPQLANHFLRIAARDFNRPVEGFAADAMAALLRHRWPGNVRELMSVVRRAVIVGDGPLIGTSALFGLEDGPAPPPPPAVAPKPGSDQERAALIGALERTDENITSTADSLNVSRVTLYRMLRRHGIVLKRGLGAPPIGRGGAVVSG
jgi:transcriptional regulator with PAS, ATPase and Fis domain